MFLCFKLFRKCNFTACYYCVHCFGSETWPIPLKILFDWDFHRYPVSHSSSIFLSDIQYHPLFNMRSIHRRIYKANKEMQKSKVSIFINIYTYMTAYYYNVIEITMANILLISLSVYM